MKIIFSRKGFDSKAGGYPSLIFPDGTLFSIPIPDKNTQFKYKDLDFKYQNESISSILNDLTFRKIKSGKDRKCDYNDEKFHCHYDPMPIVDQDFIGIAFGQQGNTEAHLRNQKIEEGDIFLFYGWFKKVEKIDGRWQYIQESPDIHLVWSYMNVGVINHLDNNEKKERTLNKYPFLLKHPHMEALYDNTKNTIYLSKEYKIFNYDNKFCLTDLKEYKGRSTWRLPACFNQPESFSFLKNFDSDNNQDVIITFKGYGQEFVLNLEKIKSETDKREIFEYLQKILK